jgi:hypothetical protein
VVLSKLGRAMGVGVPGGEEGSGEAAQDEEEEGAEDDDEELTVHLTASTGDVEVKICSCRFRFKPESEGGFCEGLWHVPWFSKSV